MNWIDAHCHLSEVAKNHNIDETLKTAMERGVTGWLSCALNREEVHWHKLNRHTGIKVAAGIHPIYDEGTPLTLEDLDELARDKQLFAIGEVGLDKRNPNLSKQLSVFKEQLALARNYDLPCVFHVVGHIDIFYKTLHDQPIKGIWHGFSGSSEIVQQFEKLGITFSLGHVLIDSLKHKVINAVIKYGNYLLETDAPFNLKKNSSAASKGQNPLTTLLHYANVVSRLNGVKLESLNHDLNINIKQYFI